MKMRKINPKSMLMACALAMVASGVAVAQEAEVKTEFKKSLLTFDLIVHNPNNHALVIVRVGARSELRSKPSFDCLSGSGPLIPSAKYFVRFHVSTEETIIKADDPVKIDPRDTVRISVSIMPDATGACGYWASNISAILLSDNGKKIYSPPELITKADVDRYEERQPEDQEILDALKLRDSQVKKLAIEHLPTSTIHRDSIKLILEKKLEDSDGAVRSKAAEVAGKMKFKLLAGKIASLLISSPNGAKERYFYAKALEELREPVATDALVVYLIDPREEFPFGAKDALLALDHPDVPVKVRQLLINNSWRVKVAPQKVKAINDAICEILVHYSDMESVKMLSELIINAQVSGRCLDKITGRMHKNQTVQDPFILALRPAVEAAWRSSDQASRRAALEILCQLAEERSFLEKVITEGLSDSESLVRVAAATCAADHGYSVYIDKITSLYKSSPSLDEKETYCEVLKKLDAPCR